MDPDKVKAEQSGKPGAGADGKPAVGADVKPACRAGTGDYVKPAGTVGAGADVKPAGVVGAGADAKPAVGADVKPACTAGTGDYVKPAGIVGAVADVKPAVGAGKVADTKPAGVVGAEADAKPAGEVRDSAASGKDECAGGKDFEPKAMYKKSGSLGDCNSNFVNEQPELKQDSTQEIFSRYKIPFEQLMTDMHADMRAVGATEEGITAAKAYNEDELDDLFSKFASLDEQLKGDK